MTTINVIGRDAVTAFQVPPLGSKLKGGPISCGMREESVRDVQQRVRTIKTDSLSSLACMAERCFFNDFLPLLPERPMRLNSLTEMNARTG
ncbi:UNVERIFIED_ORG: hypothetical protein J2W16_001209 [Pseudomonas cremoricolorata]|nr:hypothetical protein [Pseudomonas cremoricolorata]